MFIGDWRWLDFANTPGLLDWVAFLLGGLGIGFTIRQLTKSKNSLVAAEDALSKTRASLMKNQLLVALPVFSEISHSIDSALPSADREPMQLALNRFTLHAHETATLIRSTAPEFDLLAEEMIAAADHALRARSALYGNPLLATSQIVGPAAAAIRDLASQISGVTASIRNDPGVPTNA